MGWFIFFIWHWKGGLIFIWHWKGGLIFIVFHCSLCFVVLLGHIKIQYTESTLRRQNAASCLPEWQENWKTVLHSLSSEKCTSIKRGMQTSSLVFSMSKKSENMLRDVKLYVCVRTAGGRLQRRPHVPHAQPPQHGRGAREWARPCATFRRPWHLPHAEEAAGEVVVRPQHKHGGPCAGHSTLPCTTWVSAGL